MLSMILSLMQTRSFQSYKLPSLRPSSSGWSTIKNCCFSPSIGFLFNRYNWWHNDPVEVIKWKANVEVSNLRCFFFLCGFSECFFVVIPFIFDKSWLGQFLYFFFPSIARNFFKFLHSLSLSHTHLATFICYHLQLLMCSMFHHSIIQIWIRALGQKKSLKRSVLHMRYLFCLTTSFNMASWIQDFAYANFLSR